MQRSYIFVVIAMQILHVELTVGDIVIFPSNFYTIGAHQNQPSKGPQTLYEGNPNVASYSPYAGNPNLRTIQSQQTNYGLDETSQSPRSGNLHISKRALTDAASVTDKRHGGDGVTSYRNSPRE